MSKHIYSIDQFLKSHEYNRSGQSLVVGSKCYGEKPDRRKVYKNAIGIDLEEGEGVDLVHDLETPIPEDLGKFDHVDCCSVLEHCRKPWLMCENIENAMSDGATILLQVPFVWRVHNYPGDYWRYTTQSFEVLFPSIKWQTRGYLSGSLFSGNIIRKEKNGIRWMQRAEAIGFGVKCS